MVPSSLAVICSFFFWVSSINFWRLKPSIVFSSVHSPWKGKIVRDRPLDLKLEFLAFSLRFSSFFGFSKGISLSIFFLWCEEVDFWLWVWLELFRLILLADWGFRFSKLLLPSILLESIELKLDSSESESRIEFWGPSFRLFSKKSIKIHMYRVM
jgi:hypothetical protein